MRIAATTISTLLLGAASSFAPPTETTTTSTTRRSSFSRVAASPSAATTTLLATDARGRLVLPGETRTVVPDDERGAWRDARTIAVGANLGSDDDDEFDALAATAGLCEVVGRRGRRALDVRCVGRIVLEGVADDHGGRPWFRCRPFVEDDANHLPECEMVATNVRALVRTLSRREEEEKKTTKGRDRDGSREDRGTLEQRFDDARERCARVVVSARGDERIDRLSAIGWAAFSVFSSEEEDGEDDVGTLNLRHYRLRALDYDTLFDRLKLAQYMLREIELRRQGLRWAASSVWSDDERSEAEDAEGFQ